MTDYRAFREHAGIENADMTRTVAGMFPKYDKVTSSYINHPQTRGVCLLPEAEELLVRVYGEGPGLQFIPYGEKKKRKDKRRKQHQITFRMTDENYEKAVTLKEYAGSTTFQELFEIILDWAYREWEAAENA